MGIGKLRKAFNKPSVISGLSNWIHDFFNLFKKPVNATVNITGNMSACASGNSIVMTGDISGSSLEERIACIEKRLSNLRDEHVENIRNLKIEIIQVRSIICEVSESGSKRDSEIVSKIEDVAIGGIYIDMIGLVWLLVGVICTSLPKQLEELLSLMPFYNILAAFAQ